MSKPVVRKVGATWQVRRPEFGFSPAEVLSFPTWREAIRYVNPKTRQ